MGFGFKLLVFMAAFVLGCAAPANPNPNPSAIPSATDGPQGSGTSTSTAPGSIPPVDPTQNPLPSDGGDVRLQGTFTGHTDDPSSISDATFDLIVIWHRPNEIHDMLNFQFESGSFTFSTTVEGVCGGSRTEGGPLKLSEEAQFLYYGDLQDRSQEVHASLIDERLNQGGLKFALTTHFDIPSGAVGCEPPYQSYGYVSVCALEFKLATLDTLKTQASCTEGGTTWTGHLVEI